MMNSGQYIASTYPDVGWTGGSDIHRSWAGGLTIDSEDPKLIIRLLEKQFVGNQIWDTFHEMFPGGEWIVSEQEFVQLFLVDAYRHMTGQGDSSSPNKLKNPVTGNVFHVMMKRGKIVGGIRYWVEQPDSVTLIGMRFRLVVASTEKQEQEYEHTRGRVEEVVKEYEQLIEKLKIGEPLTEEQQKVRVRVQE